MSVSDDDLERYRAEIRAAYHARTMELQFWLDHPELTYGALAARQSDATPDPGPGRQGDPERPASAQPGATARGLEGGRVP